MAHLIDKEALVAEIERLKEDLSAYDAGYCNGVAETCNQILSFINSLQEEPVSEDFKGFEKQYFKENEGEIVSVYDRHAGLVDGTKWQKEQMMKGAKNGVGNNDNYIQLDDGTWIDLDPSMGLKPAFNVEEGEKVTIAIIKEE